MLVARLRPSPALSNKWILQRSVLAHMSRLHHFTTGRELAHDRTELSLDVLNCSAELTGVPEAGDAYFMRSGVPGFGTSRRRREADRGGRLRRVPGRR